MDIEDAIREKLLLCFEGTEPPAEMLALLRRRPIGGVTLFRHANVASPAQVRELTAALQRAARGGGPLLICADQEGGQLIAIGGTTPFPGNMALGATRSAELARRTGEAIGRELAAVGVNVNYAPVCDVNSNPRNPVIGVRSFGEQPELVAGLATATVEGMQAAGVAAAAKHFPGHGDTAEDSHHGLISVPHDRARLDAVELPPFRAAIAAGARLVMMAHVALPALTGDRPVPATLAPEVARDLLRDDLGFEGVVVSDALDMGAIGQGVALAVDAILAAAAGVDLLLLAGDNDREEIEAALLHAARRGLLREHDMLASAARVRALKEWLAGRPQPDLGVVGCAEHRALADETAARAVTLVRDDAGLLPLRLAPEARVAVVVPETADLTPADTSSYERCGLAEAVRRYHPRAEEHLVPADPPPGDIAALRRTLQECDLAIVGTISATSQAGQAALVNALLADGIPTVAVALRLPYDLAAYPAAPTYLCAYSILEPSMGAVAAALWGEASIGGRLPASIPGLHPVGHGIERAAAR